VSRHLLVGRLVWWVQTNADALIIGRLLGKGPLGAYAMTMTMASLPVEKITSLVTQVSPPFLAAVKGDQQALRHLLLVLTGVLSVFVFPVAVGLAVVAEDFVLFALGPKWAAVIPVLRLLSILAAFRGVQTLLSPAVVVTGGTRLFMYLGVIEAAIMSMVFYVGSGFGITGVAVGWLLVHPIMRLPVYAWIFRSTGMTLAEYLSVLWPSLRATLLMAAGVIGIKIVMPSAWSTPVKLAIQVGLGILIYTLVSLLQRRRLWGMYEGFRALGVRVARVDNGRSEPSSGVMHPSPVRNVSGP
jgi:O-antigen/teichoic acid export membrane protein